MAKQTLTDIDLTGKKILVRVDFNVPLLEDSSIGDETRLKAILPTINYLLEQRCRIILCSHLGSPNGKVTENLRLGPVGLRLSELITFS